MDMRKVAREVRLTKWAEMIQEQKSSGQSIQGWCSTKGVDKQRYYYWQRRLREAVCEKLALGEETALISPWVFAEVKKPNMAGGGTLTIRQGEYEIVIDGDASPVAIETVLRALGSR